MNFRERLIEKIKQKQSVVCMGIDPDYGSPQFPRFLTEKREPKLEFAKMLIDKVADLIPVIKPNTRFYSIDESEQLKEIVKYAHKHDLEVIGDCKENDIGNTMVKAYQKQFGYFNWDAITVNGYFGTDGIIGNEKNPIFNKWFEKGKGLFVLVKTSNPSSKQIQNIRTGYFDPLLFTRGILVWERVAELVEQCGKDYDHVIGAVIGATHPEDIPIARELLSGIILLPGYKAQGGKAEDIKDAVKGDKWCIVNSSRGIMYAYDRRFKGKFTQEEFVKASCAEVEFMKDDINRFIKTF